jgi:hypothetical protein
MVTWEQFKYKIRKWVRSEIDDDEFYGWLETAKFENDTDRTLADMLLKERDGNLA